MRYHFYAEQPENLGEVPQPCPRDCAAAHPHDNYVTLTLHDFIRLEEGQRNGAAMDPAFH